MRRAGAESRACSLATPRVTPQLQTSHALEAWSPSLSHVSRMRCFHFWQTSSERWAESSMRCTLADRQACSGLGKSEEQYALLTKPFSVIAVFHWVELNRGNAVYMSWEEVAHTYHTPPTALCFQAWMWETSQRLCWCTVQKVRHTTASGTVCALGKDEARDTVDIAKTYQCVSLQFIKRQKVWKILFDKCESI